MEIGNVVKLKEKSLYYQMYEHDTFEIEKDWDKKHWVIRGLGPIAFLWLIIPKNEIEVIMTKQEKLLNQIKDIINRPYVAKLDISSMLEESKRYIEIENLIKEERKWTKQLK